MARKSTNSVRVISVDLRAIERALENYVATLRKRSEVLEVVLFGSFVTGRYAPGSDVDLLVVLSDSPIPFWRRPLEYLPEQFPVGVDVFAYTVAELQGNRFAQAALREGKTLWRRGMPESPPFPPGLTSA